VRALVLVLGGCAPFVAPSGYEGTQYACDRPELWEALVASCVGDCVGVASLEGHTQGEPFVVASVLESAVAYEIEGQLDRLEVTGRSPYFEYALHADSAGQLELQMIVPHRTLAREAAPGSSVELSREGDAARLSFEGSFQDELIYGCVLARTPEIRVP
jgi:hypothetical protein